MPIIGVLFFFFVALSAFFVLLFLSSFIPYWIYLGIKEKMKPTEATENEVH
jgi:hypothetical protein